MTQDVKRCTATRLVENAARVNYNGVVSTARISGHFLIALVSAPLLMGGACEKKAAKPDDTGAIGAADRADDDLPAANVNDTTPLQGIDVSKLDDDRQKLFYKLVNSLRSPCDKPERLRTAFTSNTSCKRAPFAVRYVLALIEDEGSETQVREEYKHKYSETKKHAIDVTGAPRVGPEDAPVRIVEFFDYACDHCRRFSPVLDQVADKHGSDVAVHYMMFPLGQWPNSKSAAQAAIAAAAQGKFHEMHKLLFERSPMHAKEDVMGYAGTLGLDIAQFEQDYAAAAATVDKHRAQGEAVGVEATPWVFFNDRLYQGPQTPEYLGLWIEEELAVNR